MPKPIDFEAYRQSRRRRIGFPRSFGAGLGKVSELVSNVIDSVRSAPGIVVFNFEISQTGRYNPERQRSEVIEIAQRYYSSGLRSNQTALRAVVVRTLHLQLGPALAVNYVVSWQNFNKALDAQNRTEK